MKSAIISCDGSTVQARRSWSSLIWVHTVCPDLSVRKLRIIITLQLLPLTNHWGLLLLTTLVCWFHQQYSVFLACNFSPFLQHVVLVMVQWNNVDLKEQQSCEYGILAYHGVWKLKRNLKQCPLRSISEAADYKLAVNHLYEDHFWSSANVNILAYSMLFTSKAVYHQTHKP